MSTDLTIEQNMPPGGRKETRRRYKQGRFMPKHPHKYRGNIHNIRYLSSWELHLFEFLDSNPHVVEWSSEEIVIPYIKPTDGKVHRYYPDVWVKYVDKIGNVHEEIIEVKPEKETRAPSKRSKRFLAEQVLWAINISKWQAAQKWCKDRNIQFRIISENSLFK